LETSARALGSYDELGKMIEKVAVLAKDVKLVFTVSAEPEDLPEQVRAFIH
jgi:hypothetical protein